ncbi:MAG: hypothetical protein ACFE0R_09475 [Salinarimonas sp.]
MIVPFPGAAPSARAVRYNLFRHAPDLYLCCAVPEDRAVPRFIDDAWRFEGRIVDGIVTPDGFDGAAARLGERLVGFHLFMACRRGGLGAALHR